MVVIRYSLSLAFETKSVLRYLVCVATLLVTFSYEWFRRESLLVVTRYLTTKDVLLPDDMVTTTFHYVQRFL